MDFPQACLFDLDGVLLDTEGLHKQAWSKTAESFGGKLSEDQLLMLQGRRRLDCAKQILKWIEKAVSIEDFLKIHQPIYNKLMTNVEEIQGASELIRWCFESNIPMALVTSSSKISVKNKSGSNTWLKLITTRVYGDDSELSKGKPEPDPYLLAAKKLAIDPKLCWAIEDSESGTNAALKAGCKVWMLNINADTKSNKDNKEFSNLYQINHLNQFLTKLQEARR